MKREALSESASCCDEDGARVRVGVGGCLCSGVEGSRGVLERRVGRGVGDRHGEGCARDAGVCELCDGLVRGAVVHGGAGADGPRLRGAIGAGGHAAHLADKGHARRTDAVHAVHVVLVVAVGGAGCCDEDGVVV